MRTIENLIWVTGGIMVAALVMLAVIFPSLQELQDDKNIFLEIIDCELLKEHGLRFKHFTVHDFILEECYS